MLPSDPGPSEADGPEKAGPEHAHASPPDPAGEAPGPPGAPEEAAAPAADPAPAAPTTPAAAVAPAVGEGAEDLAHADTETVRLTALSVPARLIVGTALTALGGFTLWHLAMVFLFVAPSNDISEEYEETVRGYVYPEFEQNWRLFAPNPVQRNEAVHVRAEIRGGDGVRRVTDWIDLTAMDVEEIQHTPLPSHSAQNTLRRAWDFYSGSHDEDGDPIGLRGEVSAAYVHRIALLRLGERGYDLDAVERVQLRSVITRVPAPSWRPEDFDTSPQYDELNWWVVTTEDLPRGTLAQDGTDRGEDGEAADGSAAEDAAEEGEK
ncbi:DUF5819 family protein [Streptomyces sp. DSM 44917]|uniref:DUF5819 family protein n=1 Tax=Streptomyces boetiae TaxID=3075541 RepID=A0ABU2L721_9ACTN|nr:DUF5819 family protein [Streptomyces sp. DSM 44917]MDT0307093.1 DUF5819 family protein [Streptomyces sp. DSM 44917]